MEHGQANEEVDENKETTTQSQDTQERKRQRIELSTPSAQVKALSKSISAEKDRSSLSASPEDQNACLVCFEQGSEDNPILSAHNCPTCNPTAWKICEQCDSRLLSRQCPVCRSDYAAQNMYAFPGPRLALAFDNSIDTKLQYNLILKIELLKSIIGRSNVFVYRRKSSQLSFSLPRDDAEDLLDLQPKPEQQFCVGKVTITECMVDDVFPFTNKVWDLLIEQTEETEDCESVGKAKALKYIIDATKDEDAILLTPLPSHSVESIINESSWIACPEVK
jgi:hypothetical protein